MNETKEIAPRFMVEETHWKREHACSICYKIINQGYAIFEYEVILFGFTCSELCANMSILQNI